MSIWQYHAYLRPLEQDWYVQADGGRDKFGVSQDASVVIIFADSYFMVPQGRKITHDLSSGQKAGSKDRVLDWEDHRFARGRRLRANNVMFSGEYFVRAKGEWLLSCQ